MIITKSTSCLLEFSLKDGMQVDFKSECFTPESRTNTDDARVRVLVSENGRNKDH